MSYRALASVAPAVLFTTGCAESHAQEIDARAATHLQAAQIDIDASVVHHRHY